MRARPKRTGLRRRGGVEAWARHAARPGRAAASRRATDSRGVARRSGASRTRPRTLAGAPGARDPRRALPRHQRHDARCRPRGGETECRARARTERGRGRPPRAKRPPRRSETRGFEDRGGSPGAPSAPSRASRGALCRTGRRRSRTEQRWRVQTSGAKVRQAANQSAERNFGLKGRIDSDRV